MTRLAAHDVHFAHRGVAGKREVLRGVSLDLEPGQVVAMLGANGAGKSTLLRVLLGFLTPSQGSVELHGMPLASWPRRKLAAHLAYVPQLHVPPFPYTVADIVRLGRLPHHGLFASASAEDGQRVAAAIEEMGLSALASRPYTEISGGERQLTLIARALAQGARYLILDEPATGLDYGNQQRLLSRLQSLGRSGLAVLFTTHHPDHALRAAQHVLLLQEGRIVAAGNPVDVLTPQTIASLYGLRADEAPSPFDTRHFRNLQ